MTQFGENNAVPQRLLQLCGSRKLLPQTCLHPPEEETGSVNKSEQTLKVLLVQVTDLLASSSLHRY